MIKQLRPTFVFLVLLTLLFGGIYPLASTLLVQGLFPAKAQGSLITKEGKTLGSELIGQNFSDPKYFWGRLSGTAPTPYNAAASTGTNYGPTNPALLDQVKARIAALKEADPANDVPIPVDLVTASGSGLDPHLSPAAIDYQISRVARQRGMSEQQVRALVERHTEDRQFGLLGEPRVNMLMLNLALDGK